MRETHECMGVPILPPGHRAGKACTVGWSGCVKTLLPKARARCVSSARRELCGGCRATGIPTATYSPLNASPLTFYLTCIYDWLILLPYHLEVCMKTQTYEVQGNRSHLSQLLKDVASGTDVIIVKAGKPMALISRIEARKPKIRFGILKGKAKVSEDFDAPLPNDLLSEFERN